MKLYNGKKLINVFTATVSALIFLVNPLVQAVDCSKSSVSNHSSYCYFQQYPWLGLIMDEITYGNITISDVHLNKGSSLAIVKPGAVLHGKLRYRIDSTDQEAFHRYHLVVGLKGIGAQDCVTHTWGIWDSKGKGTFTLKAPLEPGLYEMRFVYHEAATCEEARSIWNNVMGEPSSFATIGAIIVE